MSSSSYLIDIRQDLHPEEIVAFVNQVKAQLAELTASADLTAGAAAPAVAEARVASALTTSSALGPGQGDALQIGLARQVTQLNRALGRAGQDQFGPLGSAQANVAGVTAAREAEVREMVVSATARARESAAILEALAADERYIQATVEAATGRASLRAAIAQEELGSEDYIRATAEANAAQRALAAAVRRQTEESLLSTGYVEDTAAGNQLAASTKARVEVAQARLELESRGVAIESEASDAEATALLAVVRRAEVEASRIAQLELTLANEAEIADLTVQRKVLEAELNTRIKAQVAEQTGQGGSGGGGPFSNVGNRVGGLFSSGGGQLALDAVIAYQVLSSVKGLVDEAQRAQIVFGQLRAQMEAVGQADRFPEVRDHILEMSRESGLASDEVGRLAATMLGAFNDVNDAMAATEAGLALVQVGGLSTADVANNLVAILKSFGITGADAVNQVDDQVLHLRDTFGVSVKEIVDGVGNIAPLANELGLSFRQTATIIAAASAASGRSATQTANEIGRALTQIQKQLPGILNVLDTPGTQGVLGLVQGDIAQGNLGQVLIDVTKHWNELTKAQQTNFLGLIGRSREYASLSALLNENSKFTAALDDSSTHEGRTAQALSEYHKTLSFEITQAKEAFRQFGEQLLRAGVGEALADLVHIGSDLIGVLGFILRIFADLNSATDGWAGRIIELAVALKALNALLSLGALTKLVGGGAGAAAAGEGEAAAGAGASAGLGPAAPFIVSAGATVIAYQNANKKVGDARKSAEDRLQNASLEYLDNLAKQHQSFADHVESALFGDNVQQTAARIARARRAQPELNRLTAVQNAPNNFSKLSDAERASLGRTADQLRDQFYNTGKSYYSDAADTLDDISQHGLKPEELTKILNGIKDGNEKFIIVGNRLLGQYANRGQSPDLAAGSQKAAQLAQDVATSQGQASLDVQDLVKQHSAGRISYDTFASGLQHQIQLMQQAISDNPNQPNLADLQKSLNDAQDQLLQAQVKQIEDLRKAADVKEQGEAYGKGREAELKAEGDSVSRQVLAFIGETLLTGVADPTALAETQAAQAKYAQDQAQLAQDTRVANLQKQRSLAAARQDSVAVAQRDVDIAQQELAFARTQGPLATAQAESNLTDKQAALVQAKNQVLQSRLSYQAEVDRGDPVLAAQDAVQAAQAALAVTTRGTGAWYDASRQLLEAQRSLAEEQQKQADAQYDYAIAVAQARGDIIQADQTTLDKLRSDLAAAQARGDVTEVQNIQRDLVSQAAKQRDDQLAEFQRNLQFQHDMGYISDQQEIADIQAYLQAHQDLTEQQKQQLLLQIHQIQAQAGQNAGFDIPTNIRLPTLYEVRRLSQSEQAGYGYNDNRTIQVQYNVYSAQDHAQALADLESVMADSPRTGVDPRSYP